MCSNRHWTAEEVDYLKSQWGQCAAATIARRLGRSELAIQKKAHALRMGPQMEAGDTISSRALLSALGYISETNKNYAWAIRSWMERGLPVIRKTHGKMTYYRIQLDRFWRWANHHRSMLNFARFEEGALGAEPDWVPAKRIRDARAPLNRYAAWTAHEDELLKTLLKQQGYTSGELARIFGRTEAAIDGRIAALGLKLRPVPGDAARWTPEQESVLLRMRAEGYSYAAIAEQLGRCEGGCRHKYGALKKPRDAVEP